MICISVTPESRRLAKVDLLNAANQSDLVELCLDRLIKIPDMQTLLQSTDKPVLVSCRRQKDGGYWQGDEAERIKLLRQAAMAGPSYIELEPDIAGSLPRIEDTQLVVSYTDLSKPLQNIESRFDEAAKLNADVIKFTWPTPTLDDAWPLLAAVSKKRDIPVVGMGLGRAGRTFSLLGRKYGSPWIYAALEKGMETHEGQVTVGELDDIYNWRGIGPQTGFIGVVGFGASQATSVRVFNSGLMKLGIDARCLPLEIGSFYKLPDMLDFLKINYIFTTRHLGEHILPLANHAEEAATVGKNADLLLRKDDGWHAYNTIWRSVVKSLERSLRKSAPRERPLEGCRMLVFGAGRLAQSIIYGIQKRGGIVSVTSSGDAEENIGFCGECGASLNPEVTDSEMLAQTFNSIYVPFSEIYRTKTEVAVFADPALELGYSGTELNPSFLRPPMIVIDVRSMPQEDDCIIEARLRGCKVITPSQVYDDQISAMFKSITSRELPTEALLDVPNR